MGTSPKPEILAFRVSRFSDFGYGGFLSKIRVNQCPKIRYSPTVFLLLRSLWCEEGSVGCLQPQAYLHIDGGHHHDFIAIVIVTVCLF